MEENEEFLNTFIDMMRAGMPEKVISNYIFIAEIVSNDNNVLNIVTSNGMTPWLAVGMLQSAEDMILSGQTAYDDDDDDGI